MELVERIYTLAQLDEVKERFAEMPSSVLYSTDHGETWQSVPKKITTWQTWNWIFAFIERTPIDY
jgi:hypothetical protein